VNGVRKGVGEKVPKTGTPESFFSLFCKIFPKLELVFRFVPVQNLFLGARLGLIQVLTQQVEQDLCLFLKTFAAVKTFELALFHAAKIRLPHGDKGIKKPRPEPWFNSIARVSA